METLSADLTRFDFYVNRFLSSEDVKRMTAEEVGQYILLLCEAWQLHKGASLPNDESYLRQVARVKTLSPRVMKKFTLVTVEVEDGFEQRLRNKRLYEEWQKAMNRYQKFSDAGKRTAEKRWSQNNLPGNQAINQADYQVSAIPYHTNPDQSIPDQKEVEAAEKAGKELLAARARQLQEQSDDE